ncbi:MAG: trigger factor [Nitrospira sp. CR1.1]|jgi:trigger factor|nr:trigger factor [Nitrospira sp. CR1.1]
MKMEMTELGPMKRALKIEVPADEVNLRFVQAYSELNRQVRIPGFRPGKAPLQLLEKRYAKTIEEDVIRSLVPDYYDRAIRQAGIVPVLVEIPPLERVKVKKDSPFSFTATVEIKPTIELRDYKAPNPISLKQDQRTVTDEQVQKALEVLRDQMAQLHPAPTGTTLAEGDFAVVDIEGTLDGTSLDGTTKTGHLHKMGSHSSVLGIEIEPYLVGKKDGDVITIPQAYPATHPDVRVAGKTVTFRCTVKSIKRKQLPALDDEFAKDCGPYQSLQEIREKLHAEMDRALKKEIEDSYKETILKRLAETHHFDLPGTLVERELSAMVRQQLQSRQRKAGNGAEASPVPSQADEAKQLQEEYRPEAERRVKVGLILEALAAKENITVTNEDLSNEIGRLAAEVKISVEEVTRMIQAGGQDTLNDLRSRILADKALDFVYKHAMIQG